MRKNYIVLIIGLLSFTVYSQDFDWAKSFGGVGEDESQSITQDNAGNIYISGRYESTVDFDPNETEFNLTSNGETDIFVQKLDASGNLIWAKSIGGTLRDGSYAITTDNSDNVYITGRYEGTVDFDPNDGTENMTSSGNRDIYILKLDSDGAFLWVKSMGDYENDRGNYIITDNLNNVYITGRFGATVDFDPGAGVFNLTTNGEEDIFVQKLDENGDFIWAKSMGGEINDEGFNLAINESGELYITGFFNGTVDFDPSGAVFNLTSNGESDVFIQKLDADGNFIWAHSVGGTSEDSGQSIISDADGNIYITGEFNETVDFDPSGETFELTSNGLADIFILKLAADGSFVWAKAIGGTNGDQGYSLTNDTDENIYVTGFFEGTVDFDPNPATFELTAVGLTDIYILNLDADGAFINAQSFGGAGVDQAYSIICDEPGNTYVTGFYEGVTDFDPNAPTYELTSNGITDNFVQKLKPSSVGIGDESIANAPILYPNPCINLVNIDLGSFENATIKVFDLSGQLIHSKENISNANYHFELNKPAGIYFVEINSQVSNMIFKLVKL